jgi:hypothetical protein
MKIACGMISAPRPVSTASKCLQSLEDSVCSTIIFHDPYATSVTSYICEFQKSDRNRLGNFQNWVYASRCLLEHSDAEAILIAEDDALFAPNIYELLQRDLWPSLDCGVVSLYCPKMSQYSTANQGLNKTRITTGKSLTTAGNLVGALALVFPRSVLQEIAYHPSVETWKGSHGQASNPNTKPWERKAVDTWIGQVLKDMGKTAWHYSPSLVYHYSPDPKVANSSLGHGTSDRNRQARSWVGEKTQDLLKLMKPLKERHDIPCADLSEHPV